jgi:Tol biopolymer transport system component
VHRVPAAGGASTTIVARAATGWPGPSPDGSLIVYADTGFSGRLVVADSTGRTLTTITPPGRETIEGWLPPATLVLSDRGDIRRLFTLPIAGGTPHLLLDTLPPFFEPQWSPNGETFSMTACVTEKCEMRIWAADGALRRALSLPDRYLGGAAWSPDGSRIAYFGGSNASRHVSVVDVAAGTVREGAALAATTTNLLWTADSRAELVSNVLGTGAQRKVVFQRADVAGTVQTLRELAIGPAPSFGSAVSPTIAIVNRNGELHRVVFDGDSSDAVVVPKTKGRYANLFAFSPGGERFALRHSADSAGDFQTLEVLTADARPVATIETPFAIVGSTRMLPRGEQLVAFGLPTESDPEAALYLVDVATKQSRKLVPVSLRQATGDLAVSPDGRTLIYTVTGTTSPRVFTMDLSPLKARK